MGTTPTTQSGTYTVYVYNTGSYHISEVQLTISGGSGGNGGNEAVSCCEKPIYFGKTIDYTMRGEILAGNIMIANDSVRRGPISYSDVYMLKKAYASKH